MTSSAPAPVQDPAAAVSSTSAPPQSSKELKESLSPTQDQKTASEALRNDDSNPQQGGGGAVPPPQQPQGSGRTQTNAPAVRHGMPQRPSLKIPPTAKDERKLFVGGLPADGKSNIVGEARTVFGQCLSHDWILGDSLFIATVTDEEFSNFFAQFGKVIDSIVMFDYETGRSRGFGFVTYEDPKVSRHLLSLGEGGSSSGRVQMRDKLVEIKAAEPKEGRAAGGGGRPHMRGGRRKVSGDVAAAPVPEAFPVIAAEGPMYPYGHAYPAMPDYGYPAYGAPVHASPAAYGAPIYAAAPAPYAFMPPGYMAPVFYPPEAAAAPVTPALPIEQGPAANFAGYAYIPFVPPSAGPPEQK